MDQGNNSFYNSHDFDFSEDYHPSLENIPNSEEFSKFNSDVNPSFSQNPPHSQIPKNHQTPQNISEDSNEDVEQTQKKSSNNAKSWTDQEDIALMSAWCMVSTNPIIGKNQNSSSFWKSILYMYEEGRKENPLLGDARSLESLRQRFRRLNKNVSKWVSSYKKAYDRKTSGQSRQDIEEAAQELYGKTKFTHLEVFERVMSRNPKWELNLDSTGYTRSQADGGVSLEESRGSSKRSRTDEDGDPPTDSIPETTASDASRIRRPIGRDKAKAKAKRKGKEAATTSQSSLIPDEWTEELRQMRITRQTETDMQREKLKTFTLNTLLAKGQLSPAEEALKLKLMQELYGM